LATNSSITRPAVENNLQPCQGTAVIGLVPISEVCVSRNRVRAIVSRRSCQGV